MKWTRHISFVVYLFFYLLPVLAQHSGPAGQKQVTLRPALPTFLYQGDRLELTAGILNFSDSEITGQVQLELFDAVNGQSVDGWFINAFPNQYFTLPPGGNETARFPVQVPFQFPSALRWRITASWGRNSEVHEGLLPVLSGRVWETESLALPLDSTGTRRLNFEKLLSSGGGETLRNQSLTVEYSSLPIFFVARALPDLIHRSAAGTEQIWNRYYGQALAARIREIPDSGTRIAHTSGKPAGNTELISAFLEETPWLPETFPGSEPEEDMALLFKNNRGQGGSPDLTMLRGILTREGALPWFKGGKSDRFITQYVATGMAHLKRLKAVPAENTSQLDTILHLLLNWCDLKIRDDYDQEMRSKSGGQGMGFLQVQYLYLRSFFPEYPMDRSVKEAFDYYSRQAGAKWMEQSKYLQGMIALALFRKGAVPAATAIVRSLTETAIRSETGMMYWQSGTAINRDTWYHAPVEIQALLVEAFTEISKDNEPVKSMMTWLIQNRKGRAWASSKATAEACYALLIAGGRSLGREPEVEISLGDSVVSNRPSTDSFSNYLKKTFDAKTIRPGMGNIMVKVQQLPVTSGTPHRPVAGWASVSWTYFDDRNNKEPAKTFMHINKKLFLERLTERGKPAHVLQEGEEAHTGDSIRVRIELRVDRDMEYIRLKDIYPAAAGPINFSGGYRRKGRLVYYETGQGTGINYFFDHLPKGNYVFEYRFSVLHSGNFSSGLTTVQAVYAPQIKAWYQGNRISVE